MPRTKQDVLNEIGVTGRVYLNNGYPCAYVGGKPAYIHRLVAEKILGHVLTRKLFVHHIDEDRTNFLPENLEVMTQGQHNGQHRRCGADNHFYGRKHSEEAKAKIRAAQVGRSGRKHTAESIEKMRAAAHRRNADPEYIKRMAEGVRRAKARR